MIFPNIPFNHASLKDLHRHTSATDCASKKYGLILTDGHWELVEKETDISHSEAEEIRKYYSGH